MPKRLPAGAMIVVGVIITISALVIWNFREIISGANAANLPKSLANLGLTSATYGPAAVQEITNLHGKEFPLNSGALGRYGSSDQVTVWVAGFADSSTAAQILRAMKEKIDSVNTPFTPTGEEQMGGRTIFQLDGMGQKHIYFQSKDLVIWLAVDPTISKEAIEQILRFYP